MARHELPVLGLGADREICRLCECGWLRIADPHAARPRYSRRLRPAEIGVRTPAQERTPCAGSNDDRRARRINRGGARLNDTFDYITRFVIVVFGYCCAVLAAGWFLAAILFRTLGIDSFMNDFVMMASDTDAGSFFAATSFWSAVFVSGFALAVLAGGFS